MDKRRRHRQNRDLGDAATGFANAISAPAVEFKTEGFITGVAAKMFVIAGPVLVYGISASVLYGAVLWTLHLFGVTLF